MNLTRRLIRMPRLLAVALTLTLLATLFFVFTNRDELLIRASATKHTFYAKLLIWLGSDVNYIYDDDSRWTALHFAAETGNIELIHFLIHHGAEVDHFGTFKVTPRAAAIMYHQNKAEEVLVAYGAKPVPKNLHVP